LNPNAVTTEDFSSLFLKSPFSFELILAKQVISD
jgi:hypothetical protein